MASHWHCVHDAWMDHVLHNPGAEMGRCYTAKSERKPGEYWKNPT